MKIEVMVDKDNTHFSYTFDCDKVIDGTGSRGTGPLDNNGKLVIMKIRKTDDVTPHRSDTIAVFNTWTFWRIIDDKAIKCGYCGRFEVMDKNGKCPRCGKPQLTGN